MIMDRLKLNIIVKEAVYKFNENEQFLLKNNLNELGIYSKFSKYLEIELENYNEFSKYVVDTDWNRGYSGNDSNKKELNGKNITLDLIVHKRGYDPHNGGYDNLICMEFKKVGNSEGYSMNERRLMDLTNSNLNPEQTFWYKIGYMIRISTKKTKIDIKSVFIDGKKVNNITLR